MWKNSRNFKKKHEITIVCENMILNYLILNPGKGLVYTEFRAQINGPFGSGGWGIFN